MIIILMMTHYGGTSVWKAAVLSCPIFAAVLLETPSGYGQNWANILPVESKIAGIYGCSCPPEIYSLK
jgi:hypothetical protein